MKVFLVDGTYELFRHHFGTPEGDRDGRAATRGVLGSVLTLLGQGATHLGVATDHVVESFRNRMWSTYKTSAGMPSELLAQFPVIEDALSAMGVVVWPMVELEADDALASAAAVAADDDRVEQVVICTPDKDLAQCVRDGRVVQVDRRRNIVYDEPAVVEKFGVSPASIPDWLALVGDSADGFPGIPGFGARTAAAVLARYGHIDAIPLEDEWDVKVRGASALRVVLSEQRDRALLFRDLATLRVDPSAVCAPDELEWHGPTDRFEQVARELRGESLVDRARSLARA